MPAELIDGKAIAAEFRNELADRARQLKANANVVPHLAAILVGDDPASEVYVRSKQKDCEKIGLHSSLHRHPASMTEAALLELIAALNADPDVDGILCQLPLPPQINAQRVLDAIDPAKDVDAFHPQNVGLIAQGRPRFLPCTPAGVQHLLKAAGATIPGKHVVVLGRSEIVGKPLAMLLMQKGPHADATVTVCHSRTQNLADHTRSADILIAAIGKAEFVTAEMVQPGAVVIDVGTNRVGDKLVGDVAFEAVSEVASAITPVPGGVGPMTRAMLLANTITACELRRG